MGSVGRFGVVLLISIVFLASRAQAEEARSPIGYHD